MGKLGTLLITGATGFLGGHMVGSLLEQGYKILVLVRTSSNLEGLKAFKNKIEIIKIINTEDHLNIFKNHQISGIIHLATDYGRHSSLSEVINSNVIMPLRLVEAGIDNGVRLFINTDTFIAKQDSKYDYLNKYSKTKYIFKDLLKTFTSHIKIVNMKLEHIYGENDADTKFVTFIIKEILKKENKVDLTAGTQKRDFIYVQDVVSAYIAVLNNFDNLEDYNEFEVGVGDSVSIKEFVESIKAICKSDIILNFGSLPMREGEFEESKANNEGLIKIGWRPKFDLISGLTKTLDWERNNTK
jgi:nucleoside-diphosphate-sugar epimerase